LIYRRVVADSIPKSLGFGGDGDEVAAIEEVEREFGVKLDDADAPAWLTAGDVFKSLRKALPPEEADRSDLWDRFAAALCGQTGMDANDIDRNSPLLSNSRFWVHVANSSAMLWIAAAAIIVALLDWALV
jgi:hypothetical protein